MKRVLLTLLAALALPTALEAKWFGKYSSYMEADNACENWRTKGETYKIKTGVRKSTGDKYDSTKLCLFSNDCVLIDVYSERYSRQCYHEDKTRQIIGIDEDRKIKKRFKY